MFLSHGKQLPNDLDGIFVVMSYISGSPRQMNHPAVRHLQYLKKDGRLAESNFANVCLIVQQTFDFPDFRFALVQKFAVGPSISRTNAEGPAGQMLDVLM